MLDADVRLQQRHVGCHAGKLQRQAGVALAVVPQDHTRVPVLSNGGKADCCIVQGRVQQAATCCMPMHACRNILLGAMLQKAAAQFVRLARGCQASNVHHAY